MKLFGNKKRRPAQKRPQQTQELRQPPQDIAARDVALSALQGKLPLHGGRSQQPHPVAPPDGLGGAFRVKAAQVGGGEAAFFRRKVRIHRNHLKKFRFRRKKRALSTEDA